MRLDRNIKYLRRKHDMTQNDLAEKLGYKSYTSIQKWETGENIPPITTIQKIANLFGYTTDELTQEDLQSYNRNEVPPPVLECFSDIDHPEITTSIDELIYGKKPMGIDIDVDNKEDLIAKFYRMDRTLQYCIRLLIDAAYNTEQQKEGLESDVRKLKYSMENKTDSANPYNLIQLPYYNKLASAGNGDFLFEDLPINTINVPKSIYNDADFVIGVDGDSMEPSFNDGDKVLVKKMDSIKEGDIGIFINEEHCYIKQLGKDGLISLNPKYPIIKGTKDIRCIGKVVGKI